MQGNTPQTLKTILNEIVKKYGLEETINEGKIQDIWEEVVGIRIARVARVVSLDDGVLSIQTDSSTWRAELNLRKDDLCKKINEKFDFNIIKEMIIK